MTSSENQAEFQALQILKAYAAELEWTAPERTIHQCRQFFLQSSAGSVADFTTGLKYLLENRYVKRLNDERLELTSAGRTWFLKQ